MLSAAEGITQLSSQVSLLIRRSEGYVAGVSAYLSFQKEAAPTLFDIQYGPMHNLENDKRICTRQAQHASTTQSVDY